MSQAAKYMRIDRVHKIKANRQRLVDAEERENREWAAIRALASGQQKPVTATPAVPAKQVITI